MKAIITLFFSATLFVFISCETECINPVVEKCHELPNQENCDKEFSRFFYDEATKSCKQIKYMGCEETGFESEQECMECECVPEDHC